MSEVKVYVPEIRGFRFEKPNDEIIVKNDLTSCLVHFHRDWRDHDGNVVLISCFPPFPYNKKMDEIVSDLILTNKKNQDTKIIFDNAHEGHTISCFGGIHYFIDKLNLNPKLCYFTTGGMQAQEFYNKWCKERNIEESKKINIIVILPWERHVKRRTEDPSKFKFEIKKKDKLFLCFNRMSRLHRIALLGLFYENGLFEKSYYSFATELWGTPLTEILSHIKHYFPENYAAIIENQINQHMSDMPLKLNSDGINENPNFVKNDDYIFYDNSYFSIVTETFFFKTPESNVYTLDENSIFFSEKIFKPIICKHPFIIASRPRSLEYLRKLGYKTFHPYIDESYDLIENDSERLLAIVRETERLSAFTDDQWIEWQTSVAAIVEHNCSTLLNKHFYGHIYEERPIEQTALVIKEKVFNYGYGIHELSFLKLENQVSYEEAEIVCIGFYHEKEKAELVKTWLQEGKKVYIDSSFEIMAPWPLSQLDDIDDLSNLYYFFVPWDEYPPDIQKMIDKALKKGMHFVATQYYADYAKRYVPYYKDEVPKKTYLCYNGKTRTERTCLVSLLSHYDLLKYGYVTYFGENYTDRNFTPEKIEDMLNTWSMPDDVREKMKDGLSKLNLPLTLEAPYFNQRVSHSMTYCGDYYKAVDFVVVPETMHWNFFISEKTAKCIELNKKFIIYGAPHYVKRLKKYYLEKFKKDISHLTDWCDTSYDDEYDVIQRAEKIIKIIKENIKE